MKIKTCVCRAKPNDRYFRRNYEGDYRCSFEEVKSMLADQSDMLDSHVLEHFSMADINRDSFKNIGKDLRHVTLFING